MRSWLREWREFFSTSVPNPSEHAARIRFMERNVALPVKAVVVAMLVYSLFYYLFSTSWQADVEWTFYGVTIEMVMAFFSIYLVVNIAMAIILVGFNQFPLRLVQWVVFTNGLVDALFLAALTLVTGGFDSILYWLFLGLIVRNAVSTPQGALQILSNLLVSLCFILAGVLDIWVTELDVLDAARAEEPPVGETATEPFFLRLFLLWLMTVCCYGVQVLFDKQRRSEEETREFLQRQEQLQATGRLAAEIAHQLKNPLGIINNAAYTLQRTLKEGKTITQQITIIREEVGRSDRIITELMGYARLAEGKVERVVVPDELDRALDEVFPKAVKYEVAIHREYAPALPPLLLQRGHLTEVFVNLLLNAREAMEGKGNLWVSVRNGENYSVVVTLADDGPGISPEQMEKVFEPYFTTKPKGTGLGLAIAKHNVEIYGGTMEVESELGKGTRFTLRFPARSVMKLRR